MAELISVHKSEHQFRAETPENTKWCKDKVVLDSWTWSTTFPAKNVFDEKTVKHSINIPSGNKSNTRNCRPFVNLKWKDICLTVKSEKVILKDLSGEAKAGELTAVMGPSGAGKTKLLDVLSGFTHQKVSGEISVNGFPRNIKSFRKLSCYILQEDLLLSRLTVRETIHLAALLKMPETVPSMEKQRAVDECMEALGLSDRQNNRTSELSGGQRKRLCIAQQLVSNPCILFLDEPTSGLDSSSCLQFIQLLKSLAQEGRTVVCAIHQPSARIFEIFDQLYMLAEGQRIFSGPIQNLIPFLAEQGLPCPIYQNPADFVTEVAMGYHGDYIQKLKIAADRKEIVEENSPTTKKQITFESRQGLHLIPSNLALSLPKIIEYEDKNAHKERKFDYNYDGYVNSFWIQLRVLTIRSLLCTYREPISFSLKFVSHAVVAGLLGSLYYGIGNEAKKITYNSGFLFFSIMFFIFAPLTATTQIFPMERHIFEREYMNSWYSLKAYYIAKGIAEIPFQIIFPLIYCIIVYWMTSQPLDLFRFGIFASTGITVSFVAQSVGQLVGAAFDAQDAVFMAFVVTVPFLLVSGYFISLEMTPAFIRWLSYLSYARFSFHNLMMSVYAMDRPNLYCPEDSCQYEDPTEFLKEFGMDSGDILTNFVILWTFFLVFRLAAYYVLYFKVKK